MFDRTGCGCWLLRLTHAPSFLKYSIPFAVFACLLRFLLLHKFTYNAPAIEKDGFFGKGEIRADDERIEAFAIAVDDSVLDDLNFRLTLSLLRGLPKEQQHPDGFTYGVNFAYLSNVTDAMAKFDWKQHEYFLNTFQHYTTEIEGLQLHFIRAKAPSEKAYKRIIPIILIHDWSSSFWEFYKIIPILANPSRFGFDFGMNGRIAFDVIVPSIPGFGWSTAAEVPGFGIIECARILDKLMHKRLKLEKYFVHGSGRIGGDIATSMAALFLPNIHGLHLSNPVIDFSLFPLTSFREIFDWNRVSTMETPTFSFAIRQPNSLGVMLRESPIALAAFVLNEWSNPWEADLEDGGLSRRFTLDEILTNIIIYWVTDTANSAVQFLHATAMHPLKKEIFGTTIFVPTAIIAAKNRWNTVEKLAYRFRNVTQNSHLKKDGSMPALEQSQDIAADIFTFVEMLIK